MTTEVRSGEDGVEEFLRLAMSLGGMVTLKNVFFLRKGFFITGEHYSIDEEICVYGSDRGRPI